MAANVYAVKDYSFAIDTTKNDGTGTMAQVHDVESMEVAIKSDKAAWKPIDAQGWERSIITGKSVTLTMKGKRNTADGGKFICDAAFKMGDGCKSYIVITFPDQTNTLSGSGVIDVTKPFGGEATKIDALEWTFTFDCKPTYGPTPTQKS